MRPPIALTPVMPVVSIPLAPFFIDGEWLRPAQLATSPVYNPSTGEEIAAVPLAAAEDADAAVRAAHAAFPAWAGTPVMERARIMFRYRALVEQHFDGIARLISREHGKTYAESRGDVFRGLEVIEYSCGAPALTMGDATGNIARGIDCEAIRFPLGVCAGITPFNFPAMVPLWMFPIALVTGNTFVLKPSEKVPLTAVRMVELLAEAGLPKGVLNLSTAASRASTPCSRTQGESGFVRRLHADRPLYSLPALFPWQEGPSQRGGKKLRRRHAGLRCREDGRGRDECRIWLRR